MPIARRSKGRYWTVLAAAVAAIAVGALAAMETTNAGLPRETGQSTPRVASVASLTTRDFRVAVVAHRLNGGAAPTARVRIGLAHRVGESWREFGERRLVETYFRHGPARDLPARDCDGRLAVFVAPQPDDPTVAVSVARVWSGVPSSTSSSMKRSGERGSCIARLQLRLRRAFM